MADVQLKESLFAPILTEGGSTTDLSKPKGARQWGVKIPMF